MAFLKSKKSKKQKEDDTRDVLSDTQEFNKSLLGLQDMILPDGIEEDKDYIYLGPENYVRILSISSYPAMIFLGWLDDVFSINDVAVSIHIEPIDAAVTAKMLKKRLDDVETELYTKYRKNIITDRLELEMMREELLEQLANIQRNIDRMFFVTIFVKIRARNLDELEQKTRYIESIFQKKFAITRTIVFQQLDALNDMLPSSPKLSVTEYKRNITAGGTAALSPISNPDLTHSQGIYFGKNYFTGSPVFIDNFDYPKMLNNPHVAVFGIPGSGKSVTVKHMLAMYSLLGKKVVVIDPEREYQPLIKNMLGGEYISIKSGVPSGINLFDIEPDTDSSGREILDIMTKVSEIRSFVGVISKNFNGRPLSGLEISAIDTAVFKLYNDKGITKDPDSLYNKKEMFADGKFYFGKTKKELPTLSDFVEELYKKESTRELAEILVPFTKGHSLGMFDCQTMIDIKSHAIGFDLFEIKDDFTKLLANYVVSTWIAHNFMQKYRGIDKIVANDETWMFVKFPESADFLNNLARRGRKHRTMLIVASQYIEEFLSNENGRAIIKSCATNVVMRQHSGSVDETMQFFNLSEGTRTLLETFNPGECILSLNGNITAVKVDPIPFEWPYIRTGTAQEE
ncbi:Type IV secretory pathway, VirB4 component [Thermoanaerobacter thermohydrosulfuricus]|uniref:Type IV secretory pathway, VirB4 component n=1 Tax=Thermoanaerobacter thermohydrosulfuricus TaxID=1516 RepID=A0A1G7ITP5_THETY|nr:ATP-binding protein [Thermoanaerobacter thermohydrosulfuricus]SDF16112.1 Type IV secretory pathway, VirB4 component [Thermoanaerobacter thermohydrosulfuricus]